jgi:hypothetical protein
MTVVDTGAPDVEEVTRICAISDRVMRNLEITHCYARHYISHLFRALHERIDLFTPPFTAEQLRLLASGRVPDGRL